MPTPSLRVPMVHATTGAGNTTSSTPGLVVDASCVAGSDYLVLTGAFSVGTSTTVPPKHAVASLSRDGWTLAGSQAVTSNDALVTATFVKKADATDPGSTVTIAANSPGRAAASLAIVKGATSYSVFQSGIQEAVTTFGVPGYTLPADQCFGVAVSGNRFPLSTTPPVTPTLATWTTTVDDPTSNATGQLVGVWAATHSYGTGTSGTVVAPVSAAISAAETAITYGSTVLLFAPSSAAGVVANAGVAQTVPSFGAATLTGTTAGGSGTPSAQSWTQLTGPTVALTQSGATSTFTAPGVVPAAGSVLTFRYSVTDGGVTSTSDVAVTVSPARYVINIGGTLKAAIVGNQVTPGGGGGGGVTPPSTTTGLRSAFPGGGGQSAGAWSPFSTMKLATCSDTGGPRFSPDQTRTSFINTLGLQGLRAKQGDGIELSGITDGVAFMTCGDGTAGNGGVYVTSNLFSKNAAPWTRLDGVAAGSPNLIFLGGNNNQTAFPGVPLEPDKTGKTLVPAQYPRHYGGALAKDETSLTGYTLLHVATVTDGAWRLKLRNSDWVCVEQVQYPGTAGLYIRSLGFASTNKSRLIISVYDSRSPQQPLLSTNANVATGSSMTTTLMTSAPANLENVFFSSAPTGNQICVAVTGNHPLVGGETGDVWISTNAHTAAAGSVTFDTVAKPQGANAPENNQWWFGLGVGYESNGAGGYNHVILVGTVGGYKVNATTFHGVWRGSVSSTAADPLTAVTWTLPVFSDQIMGAPGAANTSWLAGVSTPNKSGSGRVSVFRFHPLDQNLVIATAAGNTYLSFDGGKTFDPSNISGSADHNSGAWDLWGTPARQDIWAGTCGDWALIAAIDQPPAGTFDQQGEAVLKAPKAVSAGTFIDSRTADVFFFCNNTIGGHSIPQTGPGNLLVSIPETSLPNSYIDLSPTTDWALPVDAGTTSVTTGMAGCVGYGSAASSVAAITVARHRAQGMVWRNRTSAVWKAIPAVSGAAPFTSTPPNAVDLANAYYDDTNHTSVWFERGLGAVWVINYSAAGTPSSAKRVFQLGYSYAVCEGVGFVDVDEANRRLWIATKAGVYYLDSYDTSPHLAGTTDTVGACVEAGFATNFPGEIPGPMQFIPATGQVWVKTQHYSTPSTVIYPTNGADGPRDIAVTNPTTPASWTRSSIDDWSVSRDRASRTGLLYPKMSNRNWDGSKIAYAQQGSGLWVWSTV